MHTFAKKSSAKHPIHFALLFLANLCINLFVLYISVIVLYIVYRKFIGFTLRFLANLSNNLSYVLHRKFPICFALRFLANLSNNLPYILYRKFPIYFALRFLANLSNNLSYIIVVVL